MWNRVFSKSEPVCTVVSHSCICGKDASCYFNLDPVLKVCDALSSNTDRLCWPLHSMSVKYIANLRPRIDKTLSHIVRMESADYGVHTLHISNLNHSDYGIYCCIAKNTAGEISCKAELASANVNSDNSSSKNTKLLNERRFTGEQWAYR